MLTAVWDYEKNRLVLMKFLIRGLVWCRQQKE